MVHDSVHHAFFNARNEEFLCKRNCWAYCLHIDPWLFLEVWVWFAFFVVVAFAVFKLFMESVGTRSVHSRLHHTALHHIIYLSQPYFAPCPNGQGRSLDLLRPCDLPRDLTCAKISRSTACGEMGSLLRSAPMSRTSAPMVLCRFFSGVLSRGRLSLQEAVSLSRRPSECSTCYEQ